MLSHSIRRRGKQSDFDFRLRGRTWRKDSSNYDVLNKWQPFCMGGRFFNFEMGGEAEILVLLWDGSWSCAVEVLEELSEL